MGRRFGVVPRRRERRGGRRGRGRGTRRVARTVGDPHRIDRVGPRGRVARRGPARRGPHRRRGRARTRRRPARRLEARVRRPARRRDPLLVRGADGDRARRRPAHARSPRRARGDDDRAALPPGGAGRVRSSPGHATTTSTCSPKRTPSSASVRASRPTRTTTSNRCARLLDAELGATRKVTDKGWLPRSRQIGITGRSIAPRLFVSIGASGKFNHTVGLRAAGTVLAINADPDAPIFACADAGIVGDWREVLPLLVEQLRAASALVAVGSRASAAGRPPERHEQRRACRRRR